MKRVIVESPYAGDVERNKAYLNGCMRECMQRYNEAPFASHRMYVEALNDDVPEERQLGIKAGFAWREVAELTVFYVDLGFSNGMKLALAHCKQHKLPYEVRTLNEGK